MLESCKNNMWRSARRYFLDPLLFLLYVNDMKAAVNCKFILHADDSALLDSGKDVAVYNG